MMIELTAATIFVSVLWAILSIVSFRVLSIRLHIMQGQRFLTYAKTAFEKLGERKNANGVEKVKDDIQEYRLNCARRFLILQAGQFFILTLLLTTLYNINILIIDVLAAATMAYVFVALKEAWVDSGVVDEICNTVDEELKRLGIVNAYAQAMKETPEDPEDDPPSDVD